MVFAAIWLSIASPAWAYQAPALQIPTDSAGFIQAKASVWHEKVAKLTVVQVASTNSIAQFEPLIEEKMFNLVPSERLWIRLEVDRLSSEQGHWSAWIPLPLIDSVTLYQWNADKKIWEAMRAGDRLAVKDWHEPGRYPRFHLDLPMGKSVVYLAIQGSTPISIPLYLGTEVQAQQEDRLGFLSLGLIFGVLVTLMLLCMVTAYTYRDRLYMLYGLYVLVLCLAVGAYTGVASYLLWDHSPMWADAAQGVLALLTGGATLYFVEAMLSGRQFARRLSTALLSLGALALPLAILYYFVPRTWGVIILGVYMLMISSIGLALASRAWQRGDRVGKWVFLAYAPLAVAVLVAIARAYGWINVSWVVQYGVVVALLIEAPLMMTALHVRSRGRHEIRTRELALTTQDALTGLLREHIFDDRIRQTVARSIKHREDAAVVLISLVNYDAIARAHGLPVAEQSVLRAVIKLRKVLRNVETVARVGTSHFGLIMEGVGHRSRITDIGARLIAQGLMPLPGLVPEVTLQFHLAAALMQETPASSRDMKDELMALLSSMSRRTRRPIRFLVATTKGGTPLENLPSSPPTQVDILTEKVQAASLKPSDAMRTDEKSQEVDSSGSNWTTTGPQSDAGKSDNTFPATRQS